MKKNRAEIKSLTSRTPFTRPRIPWPQVAWRWQGTPQLPPGTTRSGWCSSSPRAFQNANGSAGRSAPRNRAGHFNSPVPKKNWKKKVEKKFWVQNPKNGILSEIDGNGLKSDHHFRFSGHVWDAAVGVPHIRRSRASLTRWAWCRERCSPEIRYLEKRRGVEIISCITYYLYMDMFCIYSIYRYIDI